MRPQRKWNRVVAQIQTGHRASRVWTTLEMETEKDTLCNMGMDTDGELM